MKHCDKCEKYGPEGHVCCHYCVPDSDHSHEHCWDQKQPPACGFKWVHKVCCLCGETPKDFNLKDFKSNIDEAMKTPIWPSGGIGYVGVGHASTTDWRDELREITSRRFVVPELVAFIEKTVATAEDRGYGQGRGDEAKDCNDHDTVFYTKGRVSMKEEVIALVEGMKLHINIDEYLPMVENWDGQNYDVPFNDGYKQAKKDLLASLQDKK